MSNRLQTVGREIASGRIEGVDFGPAVYVIARSPSAMLIWIYAFSRSLNGRQLYNEPNLCALPDRSPRFSYRPKWNRLAEGGRLTHHRIAEKAEAIGAIFGDDVVSSCANVVAERRTLLIEGGGGVLRPARRLGWDANHAWQALPESSRGFVVQAIA